MKKTFILLRILFGLVLIALVAVAAMQYSELKQSPLAIPEQGDQLLLPTGTSLQRVAADLEARGYLDTQTRWMWTSVARLDGRASKIKAGEYRLTAGMTANDLLNQLVDGAVVMHSITVPEGITFKDLRKLLNDSTALTHDTVELSDAEIMQRLGQPGKNPEGRFLPETYKFARGDSDLAFLKRSYQLMEKTLAGAWAERIDGLPLKTPYEALILASIIERETGVAGERPQIAGVFVRRLNKGMRLQTDPTVIYGLGDAYDGNITRAHLRQPTAYNTYVINGLPPTPIALPGAAAIKAAVKPAAGNSLYFVARGDGSHKFSETLEQHNKAVREYQIHRRRSDDQYQSAPPVSTPN